MKKLMLSGILFLTLVCVSHAQVKVGEVDINQLGIQYIEIYAASGIGASVRINYGQNDSNLMFYFDPLIDPKDGKPFRNTIAALNFLYQNGWELVIPSIRSGDETAPSFLLQRRKQN